jgi:hypothetical protein
MTAFAAGAVTAGSQKSLTHSNISMAVSGTKSYDPVQRWKDQAPRLEPWNPLCCRDFSVRNDAEQLISGGGGKARERAGQRNRRHIAKL